MPRTASPASRISCPSCGRTLAAQVPGVGVEVRRRGDIVARLLVGRVELHCPACSGVLVVEVAPTTPHTLRVLVGGE